MSSRRSEDEEVIAAVAPAKGVAPAPLRAGPARTFRAPSMREAFASVKATIGPEAVILTTRDLGDKARDPAQRFEVVAAWPPGALPQEASAARAPEVVRTAGPTAATTPGADERDLLRQLRLLEHAVRGIEAQLQVLGDRDRKLRDELARASQARALTDGEGPLADLLAAGLERDVASEIVERALRRATPRQGLAVARHPDVAGEILRALQVAPPLWSLPAGSVAALIGPSGAGKTTTLLKLAGLATFAHRRRVAIVSTDHERLGAFASLAQYAEVMGIPIAAARDRADVDEALDRFADEDLVLIDTPGHNPFDPEQRFRALKPASGREVRHHVVLPATLSPALVADTLAAYEGPACASLIVTRLDEARGPSALLAACLHAELPVSHLAAGREIPDDIRAADARDMAQSVLERVS